MHQSGGYIMVLKSVKVDRNFKDLNLLEDITKQSFPPEEYVPYTVVVGNPARPIRKRFDDELIELLQKFKWWDKSIDEINELILILTDSDLKKVKAEIKKRCK